MIEDVRDPRRRASLRSDRTLAVLAALADAGEARTAVQVAATVGLTYQRAHVALNMTETHQLTRRRHAVGAGRTQYRFELTDLGRAFLDAMRQQPR